MQVAGLKVGRGSANKIPLVAAVSLSNQGQPFFVVLSLVDGFNSATEGLVGQEPRAGLQVLVRWLSACFNAVTYANCTHTVDVFGSSKICDSPQYKCVNSVLGNLKNSLAGAHHALDYAKFAPASILLRFAIASTGSSI